MFYIDIKPKDNNKEVYNITTLDNNNIIKCEPPHSKRIIPQCTRCQNYGHTKTYCRKTFRCVKCAGNHETKECIRKVRDNQVKCANCNGNHPANYRGCLVHKQLQQRLFPALRQKPTIRPPTQHIKPGLTFAQTVKSCSKDDPLNIEPTQTNIQQVTDMSKLEKMLGKLLEQMNTMLNLLSTVISKLA